MRASHLISLGGLLAAALLIPACGGSDEPVDPAIEDYGPASLRNVVLVTMHATRADHLAPYGSPISSTPNIDQLAAIGVRLQQHISTSPTELPAHASMMTGLYPYRHGARSNHSTRLPDEVQTLAEVLRAQGLRTGAAVSAMTLSAESGLAQGFEHYDDNLVSGSERSSYRLREVSGMDTVQRANAWLATLGQDEPFFLWIELHEAHTPFEASQAFLDQAQGNPYDAEIAAADEKIGRLLQTLIDREVFRHTLLVITADHGQSLGEHEEATHGLFLHDATLRVPAFFVNPLLREGAVLGPVSSQADLMPTIVELMGGVPDPTLDGISMAAQLRDPAAPEPQRVVYSETLLPLTAYGRAPLYALRTSDGRYVSGQRAEMFSLARDPGETENVLALVPDDAARFAEVLTQLHAGGQRQEPRDLFAALNAADRQRLQELGRPSAPPAVSASLGDARDLQPWLARQRAALQAAQAGEVGATAQLEALLQEVPLDRGCLTALDRLYMEQKRSDQALAMRRRLAALPDSDVLDLLGLADLERQLNDPNWQLDWNLATRMNPADPAPFVLQASWSSADDDAAGFEVAIRQALDVDPGNLQALLLLATHHARRGDPAAARSTYEQILAVTPTVYRAQLELGLMNEREGRLTEAVSFFEVAGQLRPTEFMAWRHLGDCYGDLNQPRLAMAAYDQAYAAADPAHKTALNLGLLRVQMGLLAEALEPLQAANRMKGGDAQVLLALALVLDKSERTAEAEVAYREANAASADRVRVLCDRNPAFDALRQRYQTP